ncbi:hypothetical protein [Nostoc sp. UHCC 0251]|uniref:hypothetical protein n=1 Tax=Nostoc sp. UHCC 0251 TaxID=3110240 RepID=UPI002B1F37D8|nr:hypothetical protein [Nostoc sp. UHCC 0251]MEA5628093.1 hypothetical protein [Nostoc sp. UHCC 0251]
MLRLSYASNFLILTCLFSLYCSDGNSSSVATAIENQPQFSVNKGCNINFDPVKNEFQLATPITANTQLPRVRCIIRINTSNTQKQFRLVPLAVKGQVKKAPAKVGISSILIGDQPTRYLYQSPPSGDSIQFDLTNQILPTNYTTKQKSVLGINVVLMTSTGELELTEMRFALQQQ